MNPHLAVPLALCLPLSAQRFAELEPNNVAATAQAVTMGTQIDGSLTAADSDWYSFTTTGGQVRMTTSGITDTRLVLWDVTGTVALAANDDSRGIQCDITLNLPAGTYALRVTAFSPAMTGFYSLDLSTEAPAKAFTETEVEPNDTQGSADPIALPAQVDGSLTSPTDVDWYRIVLTAPRTGLFLQIHEGNAPWVSQHRFELCDAGGALLAPTTFGPNAGDCGTFTFRTATTRCWPAGTYHVVVRSSSVPPTFNPVPIGSYRLELLAMPVGNGAVVTESAEPNQTVATASPLLPGQQAQGNLTIASGADASDLWGPITITAPSTLLVQTGEGAAPAMLDTTIRLLQRDPQNPSTLLLVDTVTTGNLLAGTTGLHARATFTFFVPGLTYYLAVDSPGTAIGQSGNYVLELSAAQPAPYVAASYSVVAANSTCGVAPFPTLGRAFANETPTIGQTFSRQVSGLPMFGFGLWFLGTDNIAPVDVGPLFGRPPLACFLHVNPVFISLLSADVSGTVELSLNIPATVALRSAIVWEQAAALTNLDPIDVQFGNYARIFVGDRSY
jgi:hypothetical protein